MGREQSFADILRSKMDPPTEGQKEDFPSEKPFFSITAGFHPNLWPLHTLGRAPSKASPRSVFGHYKKWLSEFPLEIEVQKIDPKNEPPAESEKLIEKVIDLTSCDSKTWLAAETFRSLGGGLLINEAIIKESQLKVAFRNLVKRYHPDLCEAPDDPTMIEKFLTLQSCYEVLSEALVETSIQSQQKAA